VHRIAGGVLTWLERNELNHAHPYSAYQSSHVPTEYGTLSAADGQTMCYAMLKPPGFNPVKRYPVMLYVYGGPGAQLVQRRWGGLLGDSNLFGQYMAQRGYIVFTLDNRGPARRERQFTDVIYKNLGQHEVADQLAGVDWLAKQSYVDKERIGVFGWIIEALQERGIVFDLMIYPGAKHGIAKKSSNLHVFKTISHFFDWHFGMPE
jgi:dipeptidyl-peptidase-4